MTVWSRVARRAASGQPIRVGVIAGSAGRGLTHLLCRHDGFEQSLIVNRSAERGVDAFRFVGRAVDDVVVASDSAAVAVALTSEQGALYAPELARGLRHDDPLLRIRWPLPISDISDRDVRWPLLSEIEDPLT